MNAILKEKNIKFIDLLKKQNILIIKSDERIDFLNKKINVLEDNSSLDSKSLKYSFMNILK